MMTRLRLENEARINVVVTLHGIHTSHVLDLASLTTQGTMYTGSRQLTSSSSMAIVPGQKPNEVVLRHKLTCRAHVRHGERAFLACLPPHLPGVTNIGPTLNPRFFQTVSGTLSELRLDVHEIFETPRRRVFIGKTTICNSQSISVAITIPLLSLPDIPPTIPAALQACPARPHRFPSGSPTRSYRRGRVPEACTSTHSHFSELTENPSTFSEFTITTTRFFLRPALFGANASPGWSTTILSRFCRFYEFSGGIFLNSRLASSTHVHLHQCDCSTTTWLGCWPPMSRSHHNPSRSAIQTTTYLSCLGCETFPTLQGYPLLGAPPVCFQVCWLFVMMASFVRSRSTISHVFFCSTHDFPIASLVFLCPCVT